MPPKNGPIKGRNGGIVPHPPPTIRRIATGLPTAAAGRSGEIKGPPAKG
jgi:hypothetical protein